MFCVVAAIYSTCMRTMCDCHNQVVLTHAYKFVAFGITQKRADIESCEKQPRTLEDPRPLAISATSCAVNSLVKVLFTCPSRYFSAISLRLVFNVRWNLPPA